MATVGVAMLATVGALGVRPVVTESKERQAGVTTADGVEMTMPDSEADTAEEVVAAMESEAGRRGRRRRRRRRPGRSRG